MIRASPLSRIAWSSGIISPRNWLPGNPIARSCTIPIVISRLLVPGLYPRPSPAVMSGRFQGIELTQAPPGSCSWPAPELGIPRQLLSPCLVGGRLSDMAEEEIEDDAKVWHK